MRPGLSNISQNLLKVDRYRYDQAWELRPDDALGRLYHEKSADATNSGHRLLLGPKKPNHLLLDLRTSTDFDIWHLPGAINMPLHSISADSPSPFADPKLLEEQWLELTSRFGDDNTNKSLYPSFSSLRQQVVVVACYKGDTSFVATSILRAKNVEAYSFKDGMCSHQFP